MNAYKNASFIGIVIFGFGIVIAIYGFSFLLEKQELDEKGIIVNGTVVEIQENAIYRSPWVKFETLEGEEITFLSDLERNVDFFNYEVGQEVEVIYNADDPSQAAINAYWERNFGQVFLGAFGLFLMLLGWFLRRRFLRKAKQYSNRQHRN